MIDDVKFGASYFNIINHKWKDLDDLVQIIVIYDGCYGETLREGCSNKKYKKLFILTL